MHAGKGSYMCATHALELEGAYDVCSELLGVGEGDAHDAVGLGAPGGPVLVALDAGALLQPRQHHDG